MTLIIGILAAIALPVFFNQTSKAGDSKAKSIAHTAEVAMETCASDNNDYDESSATSKRWTRSSRPCRRARKPGRSETRRRRLQDRGGIGRAPATSSRSSASRRRHHLPCTVSGGNLGGCRLTGEKTGVWGS